jgi:hypothetical protein
VKITITSPKTILVAFIRATLLGEFWLDQAVGQDGYGRNGKTFHSLKSLRWENFRWTGLGQKT